jgi:peptide/nickel transport system permease protein
MAAEIPKGAGQVLGAKTESAAILAESGVRGWFAAHPFATYLIRRFGTYLVTLWAGISGTFLFFRLIPGNPIGAYVQNLQSNYNYNAQASQAVIDHYKAAFGLNGNLWDQYTHYLYQLIIGHDLGPSLLNYPNPAQNVIGARLPWTMGLLLDAVIISWVLGILLGAVLGWGRSNPFSEFMTYVGAVFTHIPYYFIALIVLFFFAYRVALFPELLAYDPGLTISLTPAFILSVLKHAALPAFSIVIVAFLGWGLGMRMQMIMTLGEDYLTFAQAKGLRQTQIMLNYAMRNSFLPQVTGLAIGLGTIFSGNILLENIFNYPGLGYLLVQAINTLDYNVIMGVIDLGIFGVLTGAFILDLIIPLLDPRIRHGQ